MLRAGRSTVLVFLALSLAGCASGPPADEIVDEQRTLDRGEFLELNLAMNASDQLRASYAGNRTLAWDVHSHEDGEVVVHDEGAGTDGTIAFQAPDQGTYSLLWQNQGDGPVEVSVTVRGQARLVSVVP